MAAKKTKRKARPGRAKKSGEKTAEGYQFIVARLTRNKKAEYADIREAAEKKGLTVYPIMYGRAKASLGLVPSGRRKSGGRGRAAKRGRGPGRSGNVGSATDAVRELVTSLQQQERDNRALRGALEKIRDLIDRTL